MYPYFYFFVLVGVYILALNKRSMLALLLAVLLVALFVFRDTSILPDYKTYVGYYLEVTNGITIFLEPTFVVGALIFDKLNLGYDAFFISFGVLAIVCQIAFLFKESDEINLSILILLSHFFIWYDLIQLRNALALGIFLYATTVSKLVPKYMLIFFTLLVHYSMALVIPLYYVAKRMRRDLLVILMLMAYIVLCLEFRWISSLIEYINLPFFSAKIDAYGSFSRVQKFSLNPIGFMSIYRIVISLIVLYKANLKWQKFYLLGVVVYFSFWEFPEVAVRLSNALFIVEIVLFSNIEKTKSFRFLIASIFLFVGTVNIFLTHAFKY